MRRVFEKPMLFMLGALLGTGIQAIADDGFWLVLGILLFSIINRVIHEYTNP